MKLIRNQFDKIVSLANSSTALQKATLSTLIGSATKVEPNAKLVKCPENDYRNTIIEMIGRIPLTDIPKQNITELVKFCHSILWNDHEDNGAIAQKILGDVHKAYKNGLDELTPGYFDWLMKLFDNIPNVLDKYIVHHQESLGKPIPSIESVKLSQDIAITVFSLFQSYNRRLSQYGEDLVKSMVNAISLPGPLPEDVPSATVQIYTDFKISQVKTLVFLVILCRSSTAQPIVVAHKEKICNALVQLMKTSPNSLTLRKEILNAFRTLLTSDDLKDGLISKIDDFLDMETLTGTDGAINESLKQVAFIHLTELLLLVKQDIKVEFIQRVVDMAIDSLMDVAAPLTLHVTSVRVLYNIVVDIVFPRRAESEQFRDILSNILSCMSIKLDTLSVQIPRILAISRDLESLHKRRKAGDAAATKAMAEESKAGLQRERERIQKELQIDIQSDIKNPVDIKEEEPNQMEVDGTADQVTDSGTLLSPSFKTVHQMTTHASLKERELLEFRNLAHGLVNTSKTVAFVIIVYHTSRGLKGPVRHISYNHENVYVLYVSLFSPIFLSRFHLTLNLGALVNQTCAFYAK